MQETATSMWHPCGTVKMGKAEEGTCVDKDFKVVGMQNLKVVDMSVALFLLKSYCCLTCSVSILTIENVQCIFAGCGLPYWRDCGRKDHC